MEWAAGMTDETAPVPCSHCGALLIVGAGSDRRCIPCAVKDRELASYIIGWLRRRNRSDLDEAFGNMRQSDYELMTDELQYILGHRGKPPNWV